MSINHGVPLQHRAGYYYWLLAALLVALSVTVGYLFIAIPNVEMFTAAVFVSGFLTGPGRGALIGAAAALLFSLFNPYGAAAPPLLLTQIISMALTGLAGGLVQRARWLERPVWIRTALFGGAGLLLTLIYDVLTTLSFAIIMAGGDAAKVWASFVYGMAFYGLHMISNTLIFALLLPLLLERLRFIITR
jgi:hypothetical protein